MKLNALIILAFAIALALFHTSCALTPEQKATLTTNALKDAQAAGLGYLAGGKVGAGAALTAQVIANHAGTTAPKQPVGVNPNPQNQSR